MNGRRHYEREDRGQPEMDHHETEAVMRRIDVEHLPPITVGTINAEKPHGLPAVANRRIIPVKKPISPAAFQSTVGGEYTLNLLIESSL